MNGNKLNIVVEEFSGSPSMSMFKRRREETKARFERIWLTNPEKLDPMRNCMERERIKRTQHVMCEYISPKNLLVADLGCGNGFLANWLCEQSANVHAVDISSNALKIAQQSQHPNLSTFQDYVPRTKLQDDHYDFVTSTELIAYLPHDEFRLYFSELARIIKSNGHVLCSTPLDINSDDALQRFATLAETEFNVERWIFSYHYLYIRLHDIVSAPSRFVKANQDKHYLQHELAERSKISKWWFNLNSKTFPSMIWRVVSFVLQPIVKFYEQSKSLLLFFEKISKFFWSMSAVSHVIFIGMRRPLVTSVPEEAKPVERKHRKQVWE